MNRNVAIIDGQTYRQRWTGREVVVSGQNTLSAGKGKRVWGYVELYHKTTRRNSTQDIRAFRREYEEIEEEE